MEAYEDPSHEGNGAAYHTGKTCITKGCTNPAGTWWSPNWCFEHNVERVKGISAGIDEILLSGRLRKMVDTETATLRAYCDRLIDERDRAALIVWRPICAADKVSGKEVLLTRGQPYITRVGCWHGDRTIDRGPPHLRPYHYPAGWYEPGGRALDGSMTPLFVADIPPAPSTPEGVA